MTREAVTIGGIVNETGERQAVTIGGVINETQAAAGGVDLAGSADSVSTSIVVLCYGNG